MARIKQLLTVGIVAIWIFHGGTAAAAAVAATDLFLAGYSVVPEPREVELSGREIALDSDWVLEVRGAESADIAVRSLTADLAEFHGLMPAGERMGEKVIQLRVEAGAVETGAGEAMDRQAYVLTAEPSKIAITGNTRVGLFYGVQTLLQLVREGDQNRKVVPECRIRDWPATELRFQHWDTKHHQDRMGTLKRYLDWSARFKFNAIGFELEDKFSYPSHPVIGAPGAFTPEELQEIVDYGLERHIQVVPQIQSPAHMAYVLKHPEFEPLRSDGSNYQVCLCDERSYELIFDMYQDAIDATQGVDYFFVSTDEVYYAGICQACERPYNPENRSLAWVEFVQRAHQFLSERGRKVLIWLEYPVLPEHVSLIPSDVIDGVWGRRYLRAEEERGIRRLAYTAFGSSHYMIFPRYFSEGTLTGLLPSIPRRIQTAFAESDPVGAYGAFWNDTGRHCEIYWLGKATVAQYGWNPFGPSLQQTAAAFMNIYYGDGVEAQEIVEIYSELQEQARFFQHSWDRVASKTREAGYGSSGGKRRTVRRDPTLPPPAMPDPTNLDMVPVYVGRYGELSREAAEMLDRARLLPYRIQAMIPGVKRNHYSLEVMFSLSDYLRHHDRMVASLPEIEDKLVQARQAGEESRQREAVEWLLEAYHQVREIVADRHRMFDSLKQVWEKAHFPKGRSVNGRPFVHIMDDVKDHWADRRSDLTYLTAPEESIGLEEWAEQLADVVRAYCRENGLPLEAIEQGL